MGIDSYLGIGKPEEKKEICVEPCESKVIFEPKVAYCENNKKLYFFDKSLQALRERGYNRHPKPAEAFDLICRGLEGRLQPEQQAVVDDMMNERGEWLSLAIERSGNKLHLYFDPENLVWDGIKYAFFPGDKECGSEKVYDIQSLSGWVPIKEVNKVNSYLVETLWSRQYAILPEEIRKNAGLYLPGDDIWPVGRGGYYFYCYYYDFGASRGVSLVAAQKSLHRKSLNI